MDANDKMFGAMALFFIAYLLIKLWLIAFALFIGLGIALAPLYVMDFLQRQDCEESTVVAVACFIPVWWVILYFVVRHYAAAA